MIFKYKYELLAFSSFYYLFCKKANDLWFDNDFKEKFPEVFYPTRNRYNDKFCEDYETYANALNRLKKDPELDIISKRKNRISKEQKIDSTYKTYKSVSNFHTGEKKL